MKEKNHNPLTSQTHTKEDHWSLTLISSYSTRDRLLSSLTVKDAGSVASIRPHLSTPSLIVPLNMSILELRSITVSPGFMISTIHTTTNESILSVSLRELHSNWYNTNYLQEKAMKVGESCQSRFTITKIAQRQNTKSCSDFHSSTIPIFRQRWWLFVISHQWSNIKSINLNKDITTVKTKH